MTSTLLTRLQHEHKLPSPRGPALAVLRLTQKESASLEELAHAISADPVLTGRILKAANAVRPIGQRPIAALRDAVRLLGFAAVRGLSLGFCLLSEHRDGACRAFDYRRYWSDCLLRGLALQAICQMVRVIPVEEGFSLGLLVRIGDLALASAFPESYAEILALPAAERSAAEKARFGESAASLSAAMLADWGLPEVLTDPVAWQDAPEAAPFRDGSRPWNLVHAIQLASGVVRICAAEPGARRCMVTELLMQGARLAIDPDGIPELVDRVVAEWQDWAALFEVPAGDLPPFAQLARIPGLEAEGESLPENAPPLPRLRVLVVDDEASLRGFLRAVLEQLGFAVREAGDGEAALAEFVSWQPDLVVTDWLMPGMDGIELVRRLRESEAGKTTFVLILTQLNDDEKLVEAFAAGVDDFIGKPLKPRVFAARLRAARRVVTLRKEIERDRESFQRCAADFAATHRRLQDVAHSDALTGLPHRQQGIALLHRAVLRARQDKKPLACILVTLPSLGPIHHAAGRQAGDRLLVQVARTLKAGLRPGDGLCRYGDRSFLIGCPRTTRPVAEAAARRIAGDVGRLCRSFSAMPQVRVEALTDDMENEDALLDRLEQAPPVAAA